MVNASLVQIAWRTAAATLGILMLGAGLIGYLQAPARWWERALPLGGAVLLIFPGAWSDAVGAGYFAAAVLSQRVPPRTRPRAR